MKEIPQLTIKQVNTPHNNWCSSGHVAPETFKNQGPEGPEEPTRFFSVKHAEVHGIYCELCLIVANYVASIKKQNSL